MEFDHEAEDHAENTVKDMSFDPPEPSSPDAPMTADMEVDPDEKLKLAILDIYNGKLTVREQRKALIFERGLLDFKKVQAQERRRSKEDREMMGKLRAFSRMMTKDDFDYAEKNFGSALHKTRILKGKVFGWKTDVSHFAFRSRGRASKSDRATTGMASNGNHNHGTRLAVRKGKGRSTGAKEQQLAFAFFTHPSPTKFDTRFTSSWQHATFATLHTACPAARIHNCANPSGDAKLETGSGRSQLGQCRRT